MISIVENEPLHNKTTFRLGGASRWYCTPDSREIIRESVSHAVDKGLPLLVLGKGSNILISDRGWPGLVLNIGELFARTSWDTTGVVCEAGVLLNDLVADAIGSGLGGIEELSGIPGTVGGAVIMNAGAFDTSVSQTIVQVTWLDMKTMEIVSCDAAGMQFGYRTSALHGAQAIVCDARFEFHPACTPVMMETRKKILARRKEKQPLEYPNCGSVFKRPPGGYAGTLIEKSGLKGLRSGDMEISVKHANFIVNRGNGKAEDVRRLIYTVQKTVYEQSGILLEPEVIFAGEFETPLFSV